MISEPFGGDLEVLSDGGAASGVPLGIAQLLGIALVIFVSSQIIANWGFICYCLGHHCYWDLYGAKGCGNGSASVGGYFLFWLKLEEEKEMPHVISILSLFKKLVDTFLKPLESIKTMC